MPVLREETVMTSQNAGSPQQPHPCRCETCEKYGEGNYADTCENIPFPDHMNSADRQYIKDWIREHGCASHSARGPVAEQALAKTPKEVECFGIAYDSEDEMCQLCRASEDCKTFKDDHTALIAQAREEQHHRIGKKLIYGICDPDGDCSKCILCDNSGGCLAETSKQAQEAASQARREGYAEGVAQAIERIPDIQPIETLQNLIRTLNHHGETNVAVEVLRAHERAKEHDAQVATTDPVINPIEGDARGYRCLYCEVRNDVKFCHYYGTNVITLPEHDATIAAQAREDVLDELAQMYANVPEQFLEGTYRLHSEWKEKIESLRHGQQQEREPE